MDPLTASLYFAGFSVILSAVNVGFNLYRVYGGSAEPPLLGSSENDEAMREGIRKHEERRKTQETMKQGFSGAVSGKSKTRIKIM